MAGYQKRQMPINAGHLRQKTVIANITKEGKYKNKIQKSILVTVAVGVCTVEGSHCCQ